MGRTYIVAVGYAGAYKAADIIVEHEKELRSIYRSSFVDKMILSHQAVKSVPGLMLHGYLGALYDLAEDRKCGICICLRKVPVMQYTVEVCELYGLNPYILPTYASIRLTEDPERMLEAMDPAQLDMAACIGYLTEGRDKIIIDKTNVEYINKVREEYA